MASTYTPIATQTLGSATTTVTFSSISGAYTDLLLVISAKGTGATGATFYTFNGDTGGNYSQTRLLGDGSSASSARRTNNSNIVADSPNTEWSNTTLHIMNYSNTTTYKTTLIRANDNQYVSALVGLWRNTSAITSISMVLDSPQFAIGSTFTLYGIKAA